MAEPYNTKDLVTALLLVLGSGPIATGIGAAVVFFPPLVKIANRRVLAASLGFSAGIMSYVSFIEIFFKSNDSFVEAGVEESIAYTYATLCFFGGVLVMLVRRFKQNGRDEVTSFNIHTIYFVVATFSHCF